MQTMQNLAINPQRLWDSLMETARIGGTAKGGICRLTLTDLDRQVRDGFKARAEKLGCRVTTDDMGAMFARREGTADVPPIRVLFEEIPYAYGPMGAKGIGELPMDGPAPAIVNAIEDALKVRFDSIPLLPEDVFEALTADREPQSAGGVR